MKQKPGTPQPADDDARPAGERGSGARLVLLIAAVGFSVLGLLALLAVLLTALLGAEVWPGFVVTAYVCLPLGFVLMVVNVLLGLRLRGRS
ncbi:hypothetical protein [Arthrobacter tecti]